MLVEPEKTSSGIYKFTSEQEDVRGKVSAREVTEFNR